MLQHNPHAHSIVCPALNVTLDGFVTRALDSEQAVLADGCPDCRCVRSTDKPEAAEPVKAEK